MAGNTIVVVGDSGSHGGAMTSGDPNSSVLGKQVCRVGDTLNCTVHGSVSLVSSPATTTISGGAVVAVSGAVASCGAVVTGSSTGFTAS